ncbi:MAG: hypothetical protein ACRCXX_13830 [Cetobacterium sp.]|uniref:hypothetical protein n=1 Tax=Cetobacterium sp. TaxID=2071632 RepID=UPI003F32B13C
MAFINELDDFICLYIATRFKKIDIIKLSKKFSLFLTRAKASKHLGARGANRHRSGKKDSKVKDLSRINKRLRQILEYYDNIEKNPHLLCETKGINIPKNVLTDWLELNIKNGEITRKYLTDKAC